MSSTGRSCGCNSAGRRPKVEVPSTALSKYYQGKENSVPTQLYRNYLPITKTQTYKEQIVEETSTNQMLKSTKYSKIVSQKTTYGYAGIPQENILRAPITKTNTKMLRLPLTDVRYDSNIVSSTGKKPALLGISGISSVKSGASSIGGASSTRPRVSNIPGVSSMINRKSMPDSVIRKTAPASSTRISQLSSTEPSLYASIDESEISFPSKAEIRRVNLERGATSVDSDEDSEMFYSALGDDSTWLTFESGYDDTVSIPCKEKYLVPKGMIRTTNLKPSPFPGGTGHSQIIYEGIPSLRKKTLKRDVYRPSEYTGVVNLDPHCPKVHPSMLYSDYTIDIIHNLLIKESKYILQPYFITAFNVRSVNRAAVINWLIKLQQYLRSDPSTLFMSVRLFDTLLSLTEIPCDKLQLVGLAAYWISSKYSDIIDCPTAAKLLKLCNNAYTVPELLKIENKILRHFHFEIVVEDPMIFVRYYIYVMQLDNSTIASICSNYLLDCFILDSECNTYAISLQAAAVVVLSLKFLGMDVRLWKTVETYPGFYPPNELSSIQNRILANVQRVQNTDWEFREPYEKYATEKYASVSLKIYHVLNA